MSNLYYSTTHPSPLGQLTLASDGEALVGLWLPGQKYFGGTAPGAWVPTDELPVFLAAKAWLDAYFAGKRPEIVACRKSISPDGMGNAPGDSLWEDHNLWGDCPESGGPLREAKHVRSGGGRGRGTQSHFSDHSLPPGGGR